MRIWVQVFSSRNRNPNFHEALEAHLRAVVDPGTEIDVRGTKKGGLGEQFRFFQAIDTPDIMENIVECRAAKGEQRHPDLATRLRGIAGHHGGEGMGRVDHGPDPLLAQETNEPHHAAKAADAGRDRHGARIAGATGHGQERADIGSARKPRRERGGFCGAAQNEDAHGHLFSEF